MEILQVLKEMRPLLDVLNFCIVFLSLPKVTWTVRVYKPLFIWSYIVRTNSKLLVFFMTEVPIYRNHSIHLVCKSMDWFLYDRNLRYERVKTLREVVGAQSTEPIHDLSLSLQQ